MTELKGKLLDTDILEHHGILGMKWGVRRFQKYPKGYSGDGKYVGPDGQPRQPTKKEAKSDRKYNELKTKIDKWLVDAVETGDKKTLKVLKKTMTPQEYQSAYDTLVKTGVQRAIKEGNKDGLKKYKGDISKRDYKDAKVMADFNDAVNKMDTKRMNTLVSKIKNEDVKAAAARIATTTEFNKKKIEALKVESEASAKLAKAATTISNVATIATKTKAVYDAVSGIKKSVEDRGYELQKRAEEINKANEKSEIDKIIRSGNIAAFEKNKSKFSNEQIEEFKKRVYLNNEKEINKAILTGDAKGKEKWAEYLSRANVETLNKATTKNEQGNKGNTNPTNNNKTDNTQTSKKNQNDTFFSENKSDTKEVAESKKKYTDLVNSAEDVLNKGGDITLDSLKAADAYRKMSFPNRYSKEELNNARKVISEFEANGSKVAETIKTSNVTTMADAIKAGTTNTIKEKLDSTFSDNDKPNIYFNGVRYTTVDEDNPNYYINGKKVNPKLKHSALEDFENFLEHHGINGMHWGVRNGPPYPLDKKVSARIRRGENEKARVSSSEYKDMRSGKKKTEKKDWAGITHLGGSRTQALNESHYREVISASDLPRMMNVAEMIGSGINTLQRLDRKGGYATLDDAKDVNWARHASNALINGSQDPGLNNNCGKCSAAMFLRSKGYDVHAGRTALGTLTSAPQYWFDGAVPYKEKAIANVERRMEAFGNKGKGILACRRADGSGHAMYFQNERQADGRYKPVIYDGQIGKKYDSLQHVFDAENFDSSQFSTVTRLDNATPNWSHLAEDNVLRMDYTNHNMNKVLNIKTGQTWNAGSIRYTK